MLCGWAGPRRYKFHPFCHVSIIQSERLWTRTISVEYVNDHGPCVTTYNFVRSDLDALLRQAFNFIDYTPESDRSDPTADKKQLKEIQCRAPRRAAHQRNFQLVPLAAPRPGRGRPHPRLWCREDWFVERTINDDDDDDSTILLKKCTVMFRERSRSPTLLGPRPKKEGLPKYKLPPRVFLHGEGGKQFATGIY